MNVLRRIAPVIWNPLRSDEMSASPRKVGTPMVDQFGPGLKVLR